MMLKVHVQHTSVQFCHKRRHEDKNPHRLHSGGPETNTFGLLQVFAQFCESKTTGPFTYMIHTSSPGRRRKVLMEFLQPDILTFKLQRRPKPPLEFLHGTHLIFIHPAGSAGNLLLNLHKLGRWKRGAALRRFYLFFDVSFIVVCLLLLPAFH